MCTVSYIGKSKDKFILTSNRDEQASRSTCIIEKQQINNIELLFPKDKTAGGSWLALSSDNRVICLLNGAFEIHQRQLPYRRSRGLMVLDFFEYPGALWFFSQYEFENMEPFTLVVYDDGDLYEFRWDGNKKHILKLDPLGKYVWSSCTLYPKEIRQKRQGWFDQWLASNPEFSKETCLDFHLNTGDGDPFYDLVMNRNGIVQTVSVSSVVKNNDTIDLQYYELVTGEKYHKNLVCK